MTKATFPKSGFYNLYFDSQSETDAIFFSRLELTCLLGGSASLFVTNIPTSMIITQNFNCKL